MPSRRAESHVHPAPSLFLPSRLFAFTDIHFRRRPPSKKRPRVSLDRRCWIRCRRRRDVRDEGRGTEEAEAAPSSVLSAAVVRSSGTGRGTWPVAWRCWTHADSDRPGTRILPVFLGSTCGWRDGDSAARKSRTAPLRVPGMWPWSDDRPVIMVRSLLWCCTGRSCGALASPSRA